MRDVRGGLNLIAFALLTEALGNFRQGFSKFRGQALGADLSFGALLLDLGT